MKLSYISICILNQECAVLPPGNNVAAIPDDAVAKIISPLLLKLDINVPVPPGPSIKNTPLCF